VERCRVLEVACGDGANLIPMAYAIPTSEFVGFDLAESPIERGQERIRELGLGNVRLFQGDLMELGAGLGRFDYVVAHGFYAWVPEPVRNRLLALLDEWLTDDGIAFISYNSLPGAYMRTMMREMMRFRTQGMEDLNERVAEGFKFLNFLVEERSAGDAYRTLVEAHLRKMEARHPAVTCHDEMSDAYEPVYFSDFADHARQHGLQYLSEAELPPPPDPSYRAEIQSALKEASGDDLVRKEQMLDFLRMRAYRETLLCRADRQVERGFPVDVFRRLQFASQTTAAPGEGPGATAFVLPGGIRMESNHPGVIALLTQLGEAWPASLGFEELAPLLAGTGLTLNAEGATLLVRLAVAKMIELRAWRAPVSRTVTERPRASAVCRQEARTEANVTSLLHKVVNLGDTRVRGLLGLLDGTRDRKELLVAMKREFAETTPGELEAGLEPGLRRVHAMGILEA
jgi:methyltransferase-like protein